MISLFNQGRWLIHAQSLLLGLGHASFYPLLGLYLANEIGVEPIYIGVYVTATTVLGVVASQVSGKKSDNGLSRKGIMICSSLAWIVLTLVLAVLSNYWLIFLLSLPLAALGAMGFAQLFAFAKEYSTSDNEDLFISVVRAQFSLAWVAGPPLVFLLAQSISIRGVFLCSSGLFLLATILTFFLNDVKTVKKNETQLKQRLPIAVWLFVVVLVCISTANLMYMINMPLYVVNELQLFATAPGWLMGMTAALEIPLMIAMGLWASRLGAVRLLVMGAASATAFFPLFAWGSDFIILAGIQVLNAFMIAVFFTTGISYLQGLMTDQPGYAASLHTDAFRVGAILAGLLGGLVAQHTTYHSVLYACSAASLLALCLMFLIHRKYIKKSVSSLSDDQLVSGSE